MEEYLKEISYVDKTIDAAVEDFLAKIKAVKKSPNEFVLEDKLWYIDEHPFNHSDDIIIPVETVRKYDNFLLIKTGSDRIKIVGWTTREQLLSTPSRDIYRTGRYYHIVFDVNINSLENFKIKSDVKKLNTEYIINQQQAENLGYSEMISGILGGLHFFAKKANVLFKDLNQKDECLLGEKRTKLYTRDAMSDEDMLISETYFRAHPEIELYICVKIKGGNYNYVGFVDRETVAKTRIVQMIGSEGNSASKEIRRIFAEQYKNLSEILPFLVEIEDNKLRKIIPQNFVPLHLHTEYSIGDGFGTVNYVAETLQKRGFSGAAITDHGTMSGVFSFQKALLVKGLKPVLGCEFYIKYFDDKRNHITVLVKNQIGWENILKLQKIAVENFYKKPLLPFEELFNHCEGLIILSGCMDSIFHRLVKENQFNQVESIFKRFQSLLGEDFYFEFQPHNIENQQESLKKIHSIAKSLGIQGVVTLDSHYPSKEDKKYQEAIKSINYKTKFGESGFSDNCFYLMTEEELSEKVTKDSPWALEFLEDWKKNTLKILEKIDFKITAGTEKDTLPKIGKDQEERDKIFLDKVYSGLEKNTKYTLDTPGIKERLVLETERIISKQYTNYFLIVDDMISWAKKNGIFVGPGRGSVGASLAALCMGITTCDPIEYDLLFDRFLSEIRKDMPDVDMDYQDDRRQEVFQYLRDTYGEDHCAKVITFSRFHPKGILKDIGRIFSIPPAEIEKVSKLIIERSGGDARASFGLMDTFEEFKEAKEFKLKYPFETDIAIKLEGHLRHLGIHAAAMITTEKPIAEYVPIGKLSGEIITEFEKFQCEELNLTKFDILGLRTLSILKDCIKDLGVSLPNTFDDEKVYENILMKGDTLGVFQLNTVGMTKFIKQLKPENFQEIYDTTTLFRPSALHSGQAQNYINIKYGKTEDTLPFECLRNITKDTKGLILYQEQVMQILNQVGDLSWATAEMSRKVMTKSKGKDAMNIIRKDFVTNAQKKHGLTEKDSERIFDIVSTFGSYGFNKAHAVEYSIISYWCAWLKFYYPENFYKSILKYEQDDMIISSIMQEMENKKIVLEFPDINHSDFSFSIYDKHIYSGLNVIKGVGEKITQKIIANRPYKSREDFVKRVKVSQKILQGLDAAGAFRHLDITGAWEEDTENILKYTKLKPKNKIKDLYDFGSLPFTDLKDLGDKYKNKFILVRGMVTAVINKDKLLRKDLDNFKFSFERHMIYLNLNDGTDNLALQIGPAHYQNLKDKIERVSGQLVIAIGVMNNDGKKMYLEDFEFIKDPKEEKNITNVFLEKPLLNPGEAFIFSAQPRVSKNGKSYYNVILSTGEKGMCFFFDVPLKFGMRVSKYKLSPPFISLWLE